MSIEYVVIKSSLLAGKSFPVKTCFLIGIRPCWPLEEICQSCQILGLSTPCLFPIWMVITDMIITEIQISRQRSSSVTLLPNPGVKYTHADSKSVTEKSTKKLKNGFVQNLRTFKFFSSNTQIQLKENALLYECYHLFS